MKEKKSSFWRHKNEADEANKKGEEQYETEVVTVKNQPPDGVADCQGNWGQSDRYGSGNGIGNAFGEEKTVSYKDYMAGNAHRADRDDLTRRMDDLDSGSGGSASWEEAIDPVSVVLQQPDDMYGISAAAGAAAGSGQRSLQKSRQNTTLSTSGSATPFIQPVGWLVCVEGEDFGKSFPLKEGVNTLGRSQEMDIALLGDRAISRATHALVVYEESHRSFLVKTGDAKRPVYVNDDMVLLPMEMRARDLLCVGDTRLMLIPCCDENFSWRSCGYPGN